ncbi:Down syndrome cell adhesion molecule-like protein Dscam2 [Blattella germanica]|nr:Down syndrome cell adhesion molecule-like protein Dscam2 [Blattella germanica]
MEVLMIEPVIRKDRGMYQCIVSNTEESAQGSAQLKIGNSPPVLLNTFRNETLHPGESWSAKCEATGAPLPDISWRLDNETLSVNERVTMSNRVSGDSVFSYVNISSLKLDDGGYYECIATNKMGIDVYGSSLHIYGPPHIKPMPDYSVIAGQHAEFHCSVVGYPISDIRWEKDGRSLPENHRQIVYSNGTLVIREIQKYSDQGGYVCVATSPNGQTAKRKFNVVVMEAPVIDPFTIKKKLQRGMRMHLTCVVSKGDFPVIIRWLKDGELIHSNLSVAERALDEYSSTLIFSSLTTSHTGNYTCEASNSAAVTTYTASIVVHGNIPFTIILKDILKVTTYKKEILKQFLTNKSYSNDINNCDVCNDRMTSVHLNHIPPSWLIEPKDSEVAMGLNISIDCSADGLPKPEIHWTKSLGQAHAQYIELHQVMNNYLKFDNGTLKILNTRPDDRGYYLCHATRFAAPYKNVTAIRGNEATLDCLAEGDKPITIIWYREGRRFDPREHTHATVEEKELSIGMHSLLMLQHVRREDTSYFECMATNQYGSERMELQLLVQEPPEPPFNIRVSNFSSRSVNLSWEMPYDGNSPIKVYVIQYKNYSDTWQGNVQHVTVGGDQIGARIPTLQPASSYEFRVLAQNSVGASNESESVLVNTLEEVPGGPPTDVRVKARNSETLMVSWKPPEHHLLHGEILGYYIGYRKNDSAEPFLYKTLEVSPGTELQIVLKGLHKFTEYIVLVQSYNRAGAGPRSEEVMATTEEDVPGAAPTDVQCSVVTPQGITVSWAPPPPSDINGVLLGYKVLYKAITDWGDPTAPLEKISQDVKVELFNLETFCNYSIEVRAYTRKGDGISSRPLICRTQEDLPSEPSAIKAVVMDKETILLSWKSPRFPNGIITKYKVYMHPLDDTELDEDNFEVPSQETYYTITHLIVNHRYEFWVTAYTIIGQGPPSQRLIQSPSIYVPAKIASFSNNVIAAWKEVLHLQCLAVGYPMPEHNWIFNGKPLQDDTRVRINKAGTLIIASVQSSDAGNYSCTVENKHAKDEITYSLIFHPHHTHLLWLHQPHQALHCSGDLARYYLKYKREFGEWEKIKLSADKFNYTLGGLQCGTKYQFSLLAFNQLGMSNPTDILPTRTQGSAPKVPLSRELIRVNSTSISLDLGSWQDGGCPITSLVVEYKLRLESQWTLVSNNIKFEQIEFLVLDLNPETWYTLRMTAHNSAGSSVVEFDFVTLTSSGATVPPDLIVNSSYGEGRFYNEPGIVISLIAGILVIIVACVTICYYYKKKKETFASNNFGVFYWD